MDRIEWKEYYRNLRTEARSFAKRIFEKYPDADTVTVPWLLPFYNTTGENKRIKLNKEFTNSIASIEGELPPFPEVDTQYFKVSRSSCT